MIETDKKIADLLQAHPGVDAAWIFGSFADGPMPSDSDLDVVLIVERASKPFEERAAAIDATELPVPADVLVYTMDEWTALRGRMREVLQQEVVWVAERH